MFDKLDIFLNYLRFSILDLECKNINSYWLEVTKNDVSGVD